MIFFINSGIIPSPGTYFADRTKIKTEVIPGSILKEFTNDSIFQKKYGW